MAYVPFGVLKVPIELHGANEAEKFLRGLGKTSRLALASTINALAENAKTNAITTITNQLNLSKNYVTDKFEIISANEKTLTARVRTNSKGLLLNQFEPKQVYDGKKRHGVSVKVKKQRKAIKKAFLVRTKGGRNLVVIRTDKGRNAFKPLYGPSTSQAFNIHQDDISQKLQDDFFQTFNKELEKLL